MVSIAHPLSTSVLVDGSALASAMPHQLGGSVLSTQLGSKGTLGHLKFDEVELMPRQILLSEGMPMDYIYLIQSGLVSLLRSMEDGATVEVGLVGRDGFAGLEIVLGSNTSKFEGVVQIGGSALRIRARTLREELARNHVLRNHLLDRAQALLVMISQTAACNVRHTVKRRLARWMLLASDYMGEDVLPVSHELLSTILGTRRAGITAALGKLRNAGLIRNDLGRITILDGKGLEAVACECYWLQLDVRQLLTGGPAPAWDAQAFVRGNLHEGAICDRPARGKTRGIPLSLDITRSFPYRDGCRRT